MLFEGVVLEDLGVVGMLLLIQVAASPNVNKLSIIGDFYPGVRHIHTKKEVLIPLTLLTF